MLVEQLRTPVTERMSLLPSNTYNRILRVTRVSEVHLQQRIIVRELEITCPYQCIRIDTDNTVGQQILRLLQRTNDGRVLDLAQLIYPEGIYTSCCSGRIRTRSHVELVTLRQCLVHVHPAVAIVKMVGIEGTNRIVHRSQCVHNVLFLALPRNFLVPVKREMLLVEVLILRLNSIIRQTGSYQVGQRDRVTYPVYKLAVLIVCDLRLVHPESIYGYHQHVIRLLKNSGLRVGSHHKRTLLDEQHTIRISLLKRSTFACTYQFSGRFVATRQCNRQSDHRQNLCYFHIHLYYKYLIDLYLLVRLGFKMSNPYARNNS